MMRPWLAIAAGLTLAAMAQAQGDGAHLPVPAAPGGVALLPPPPQPGSAMATADRAIFIATRALKDRPRWRIAAEDVHNAPLDRYACAMGVRLSAATAPGLSKLIDSLGTGAMVDPVKAHYQTPRPFLGTDAPICESRTAHLARNGDYPSGHAANGWLEALVLAELMPDRAPAILSRGRAYGESRVVCGSHTVSAVQAGWMAGSAVFTMLNGNPDFRREMDGAKDELVRTIRSAPKPDARACAIEAKLLSAPPW